MQVDSALALLMKEMGDTGRPKETAHQQQHGKVYTDRDEGFSGGGGGSRGKVRSTLTLALNLNPALETRFARD